MNKSKCPTCSSSHTKRNGRRNGVQMYKCVDCGYQFRNSRLPSEDSIWKLYQENKQTVSELAEMFCTSESTIKRQLANIKKEWVQPDLSGCSGHVHLDATYWGHNWDVMLALDDRSGYPLYVEFIKSETNADYSNAVKSIEERGYVVKGLIIDGGIRPLTLGRKNWLFVDSDESAEDTAIYMTFVGSCNLLGIAPMSTSTPYCQDCTTI